MLRPGLLEPGSEGNGRVRPSVDFGATEPHFLLVIIMLAKVELGAPRTEEAANARSAGPGSPLSAPQGSRYISSWLWLVTTLRHDVWTSCILRNRCLPTPGTLPPAMLRFSQLCGQTGPFWQAGMGSCRHGAVASQKAGPSAHLIALTCLFSCNKAGWPHSASCKGLTQPPWA